MKKGMLLIYFLFAALLSLGNTWAPPVVPSSGIGFANIDGGSFSINWTNGDGAQRIIIMRQGSAVTALPVNGVDYNDNSVFGSGDAVQAGQFVVYDNFGSFAFITGLQPGTTYHIAIFEYNGAASTTEYLTSVFPSASQATVTTPSIQASNLIVSGINGNSMSLTWTNGNGQGRFALARQGSAVNVNPVDLTAYFSNPNFGDGTQLGTGNYAIHSSADNTVTVTNLQPNTNYHYAVFEYNGTSSPVYLTPGATANAITAPRPTIASSDLSFPIIDGGFMRLTWTSGNGARRIIVARAGSAVTAVPSDATEYTAGAFGTGDVILPGQFVVYNNNGGFADISGLQANTSYHFRIYELDGTGTNTAYLSSSFLAGNQSTLGPPSIQASAINFTNLSGSSVTVNWTNGNGAGRIVVAREGSAVNANPVNLNYYPANPAFNNGTEIGTGNYVLYNQTGNSVDITNLQINTSYHFAIYEFNGSNEPVYLTPAGVANITTPASPTVAASDLSFGILEGGSFRIQWTNGNGQNRIVVARSESAVTAVPVNGTDYNANSIFGSGDAIAPGEFVVFDNSTNFADITGLQPSTTYHFRIYEYNGSGTTTSYLTASFAVGNQATLGPPGIQASAVIFSNIAGSSVQVNWTNGDGDRRIVVARQGSAVNANPVNLTTYTSSTIFGTGSQIGTGNYAIDFGTSLTNSVVNNLIPNTNYHFAIFEYNGSNGPVYLIPGATGNFTTAAQPTIAASNANFFLVEGNSIQMNWTNGNGANRIVVARAGTAVTAIPANGTDYNHNASFGNGDPILAGQFVVYDGSSAFVNISNLIPNTIYHFAVFEYDGSGTSTVYMTSSFLTASQSTVAAPSVQASNIGFSSLAATSVTVNWTAGNGSKRIVLARQGAAVNADPVNLTTYNASEIMGSGSEIGTGNFVMYNSNATIVNLTGLISGDTYHFRVYEFNGNSGPVYLVPGLVGQVTTLGAPQTQATNAAAGNIMATSLQLNWTNGSGNRRLVLMKQGSAVNAIPLDNTIYTANSFFGSGTQLGTGNYTVFNGVGSTVTVSGLQVNNTYHFAVFEFNDFGAGNSQYLITNPARGSATTQIPLPLTFISFTAKHENGESKLTWITENEVNTSHFYVERSNDGRIFIPIGQVPSHNTNGIHEYNFIDRQPEKGLNYYRVKQVDIDGQFEFSRTARISTDKSHTIVVSPNPASGYIEVNGAEQFSQLTITDMNGRILMQYSILPAQRIDISGLPAGIYFVRLLNKEEVVTEKFIKQ